MALTKVQINLGTTGNLSGSRSLASSSLASRITTSENELSNTLVSGSAQLAADISGSFGNQRVGTTDSPVFNAVTVGTATVTGTLTAQEVHTEFESASILFTSGSTVFGNSSDDIHNMTGSLNISGSFGVNDGNVHIADKMIAGSGSGFGFGDTNHSFTVKSSGNNSGFSVLSSAGGELLRFIQESNDSGKLDIYDGGSLKLRLSAHANESSYINNGGKFGIGTASPAKLLHVNAADGEQDNTSVAKFVNLESTSGRSKGVDIQAGTSTDDYMLSMDDQSGTTKFRFTGAGELGIGTGSPGYLTELRINDTTVDTPRLVIRQLGAGDSSLAFQMPSSPYGFVMGVDNSDSDRFKISTGVGDLDSSPRFEIDPDGTTIHRYAGAENTVQIHSGVGSSTTGVSQIYFSSKDEHGGNTHQSYIKSTIDGSSSTSATKMSFHNRDSGGTVQEYLTIKADGKIGIGTANPIRPLGVSYGAAKTSTSTAYAMSIQSNESANQAALQFYVVGGASAAVRKFQLQTTEVGVANAGIIEFQPDGGDVRFPNGILFGSDTAAANELDDYEEGEYTITITGSSGGSWTMKNGYAKASYTKIGRLVTVTARYETSSKSGESGDLRFNLPFTVADLTDQAGGAVGSITLNRSAYTITDQISPVTFDNVQYFSVQRHENGQSETYIQASDIDGTFEGHFTLTYVAA